jgi:hypothetical protein
MYINKCKKVVHNITNKLIVINIYDIKKTLTINKNKIKLINK